jgi:hypothetical protein
MDSRHLPPLNHRSLLILYGASALILIPFGFLFAFAVQHGRDRTVSFVACLALGVVVALVVWTRLERKIVDHAPHFFPANPGTPTSRAVFQFGVMSSSQAAATNETAGSGVIFKAA